MTTEIINTWRSVPNKIEILYRGEDSEVVKQSGDYRIFKKGYNHYIYTYKNYAFNELAGLNVEHFQNVIDRKPLKPENKMYWLYNRAIETLNKIKQLSK